MAKLKELQGISDFEYDQAEDEKYGIILATGIVIKTGCKPVRVVMRKNDQEEGGYFTHNQILQLDGNVWRHHSFYDGHYDFKEYEVARADFDKREERLF